MNGLSIEDHTRAVRILGTFGCNIKFSTKQAGNAPGKLYDFSTQKNQQVIYLSIPISWPSCVALM